MSQASKVELEQEIKVYFDFPIDGKKTFYKISAINGEGIMIRNDEIERPKGHA